jgi:hypothetical protein
VRGVVKPTARTSRRVALAEIAALEAALARAAEGSEEAAELRARIWAKREVAGLRSL